MTIKDELYFDRNIKAMHEEMNLEVVASFIFWGTLFFRKGLMNRQD